MSDINECSPSYASAQQTAELLETQVSSFENPPYPFCQVAGDTYFDVDASGHYSPADMVFGPDGIQLNPEQVQQKLQQLGYNPDFVGCFAVTAPTCYGDIDQLRLKHGMWPENFSVIAAADSSTPSFASQLSMQLSFALEGVQTLLGAKKIFQYFAYEHPLIFDGEIDERQRSVGWLGSTVGWLYKPETLVQDALSRHIIIIISNNWPTSRHVENDIEFSIDRVAGKYQLPPDHLHWVESPKDKIDLEQALHAVRSQFSIEQDNEVMVFYLGHGFLAAPETNWSWSTELHNGFFSDTILTEREFRDMMIGAFPPEKAASVLLIVESCYSGLLVSEKPVPRGTVVEKWE